MSCIWQTRWSCTWQTRWCAWGAPGQRVVFPRRASRCPLLQARLPTEPTIQYNRIDYWDIFQTEPKNEGVDLYSKEYWYWLVPSTMPNGIFNMVYLPRYLRETGAGIYILAISPPLGMRKFCQNWKTGKNFKGDFMKKGRERGEKKKKQKEKREKLEVWCCSHFQVVEGYLPLTLKGLPHN